MYSTALLESLENWLKKTQIIMLEISCISQGTLSEVSRNKYFFSLACLLVCLFVRKEQEKHEIAASW